MGAILCAHPVRGEPRIQRYAKGWQQNHSPRNFCSYWIFAGEGSTEADDVSFTALHYICIGVIMITAQTSTGVRWIFPGVGAIMDFSLGWPKNFFLFLFNSGEFDFINSKLIEKHIVTKNLINKYLITTSTGLSPPPLLTLMHTSAL